MCHIRFFSTTIRSAMASAAPVPTIPDIAIIGAGPGGLAVARLLELKGYNYAVYERDSIDANRAGGSLDLHPNTGQFALKEAGLLDAFKAAARYEDTAFSVVTKSGETLLKAGQGRDAPEIDRSELRRILLDSIPSDKIKWGHALASTGRDESGRPVLTFANGTVLAGCKLAVGADGAWSKVRHLVTDARPVYSGNSTIEARIEPDSPLYSTMKENCGAGMRVAVADHKQLIVQRQGDRSYRIYFGFATPEGSLQDGTTYDLNDVEGTRGKLLSESLYGDWGEVHKDMIRHATNFRPWTLYSLDVSSQCWDAKAGVTLLGDAAHLSVPNGEGVNLALFDAFNLMAKLEEHGSEGWARAVREYELDMFERGKTSIADGHNWAKLLFGQDAQTLADAMRAMGA